MESSERGGRGNEFMGGKNGFRQVGGMTWMVEVLHDVLHNMNGKSRKSLLLNGAELLSK